MATWINSEGPFFVKDCGQKLFVQNYQYEYMKIFLFVFVYLI